MKFLVNSLPYYGDECPFWIHCNAKEEDCPRKWPKEKVCSYENPHECEWLAEHYKQKHW